MKTILFKSRMIEKISKIIFIICIIFSFYNLSITWNFPNRVRLLSFDLITRRVRNVHLPDDGNISEGEFQKNLSSHGLSEKSIDEILKTIIEEFRPLQEGQAKDLISDFSKEFSHLYLDLGKFFETVSIKAIKASDGKMAELRHNLDTVFSLAEYLNQKLKENSEQSIKSLVTDAFMASDSPGAFSYNIETGILERLSEQLEKNKVNFNMLKIISHYCAKNSANQPREYLRNLGHVGEVLIGGLKGKSLIKPGKKNKLGEKYSHIREGKRPNPEDFLNNYLPMIDKVSWSNPAEFRSNINTFAFNTADLLLNHIVPKPIIKVAYSYAEESGGSAKVFRSVFTRICSRAIFLGIEDSSKLLTNVMEQIIAVSKGSFEFFDRNVAAVRYFKNTLVDNGVDINKVLLPAVEAAVMASGGIGAQFRKNLGEKEGIGHLIITLKGKVEGPWEIEKLLRKEVPKVAQAAVKKAEGRERGFEFRRLLKHIIDEYS